MSTASVGRVVVALGNFDGVHLGHALVVGRAVEEGQRRGVRSVAVTFDPHPRAVLRPGSEPKLLTTPDVREELLLGHGVDEVRTIRFDRELSQKGPWEFVRDVLVREHGAGVIVVGENFRFGYKASGDFEDLRRYMREFGGEAYAVPIYASGVDVNSTRIRDLLAGGEAREAAKLLGRAYLLRGEVVEGDKRGRSIGFPTANILPDPRALVPGRGVYAGRVIFGGESYGACTNVGVAPTFDRRESKVEAHLLDFEGDLYGEVVDVTFEECLRPEMRFDGVGQLKQQIARDVEAARRLVGEGA
ncbi:MAG: FMN adenylyltransferase / Riboflavin kinase [uncultured Rubrobacteraceae bacterium]|uniref:Riboflavin biosynthesis protein n=1 Tax=uncultured Rubrobacteraceae bacterium TaxID=349277 RepID=A0A6J4QLP9_9ACTN|nr:MAG: FMN adenylyltransferase / Riboflavin kinase [uncultured Rubrobacteraceae bacterium]